MLFVLTLSWRRFVVAKRRRICRQGRGCISVSCAVSTPVLVTNLGHVTTGRGTIFISRNKFLSSRGRELAAGPADEQLFARQNFPCPAMGLSYPDMSFRCTRTPPTARSKNVCRLTTTADSCQCDGVGVCNTSRREASSSLLRGAIETTKEARRSEARPVEIDHHTASMGQRRCRSAAKSVKLGLAVIA